MPVVGRVIKCLCPEPRTLGELIAEDLLFLAHKGTEALTIPLFVSCPACGYRWTPSVAVMARISRALSTGVDAVSADGVLNRRGHTPAA